MTMAEVTEDSMFVVGPRSGQTTRRRGRPRTDATEPVMTRLPLPVYDQIVKTAHKRGESVSAVVRTLLTLRIRRDLL
jgi:hypothetical protein